MNRIHLPASILLLACLLGACNPQPEKPAFTVQDCEVGRYRQTWHRLDPEQQQAFAGLCARRSRVSPSSGKSW